MAATAVSFKFLGTFVAPVYQRACNVHFPNLQDMFIMVKASLGIKRPTRDACLCMGELLAPPAPAAPPAPPAPHFVFLITL